MPEETQSPINQKLIDLLFSGNLDAKYFADIRGMLEEFNEISTVVGHIRSAGFTDEQMFLLLEAIVNSYVDKKTPPQNVQPSYVTADREAIITHCVSSLISAFHTTVGAITHNPDPVVMLAEFVDKLTRNTYGGTRFGISPYNPLNGGTNTIPGPWTNNGPKLPDGVVG